MDVEIVENTKDILEDEEDEDKHHNKCPKVTMKEVENTIELLRSLVELQENVGQDRKIIKPKKVKCQKSLRLFLLCLRYLICLKIF